MIDDFSIYKEKSIEARILAINMKSANNLITKCFGANRFEQ